MKRVLLILLGLGIVLVVVLGIRWGPRSYNAPPLSESSAPQAAGVAVTEAVSAGQAALLGETILAGYAHPHLPPENDLTLMSRLMENALLLVKSGAARPLGANEDWANFLRGINGASERFLPGQHAALNADGRLVDRWGTPLFFHALGSGRYEIRSAGPDRSLWTSDDLHRNADGSFRRGAALDAPSLLEAAAGDRRAATAPLDTR